MGTKLMAMPWTDQALNNHGTLQGNTTYSAGKYDGAFSFHGNSADVGIPSSVSLNPRLITVEAWVKLNLTTGYQSIVSKFRHNDGDRSGDSFYLGLNGSRIYWQVDTASGDYPFLAISPINLLDGRYHHFAGTLSEDYSADLYLDGFKILTRALWTAPQYQRYGFAYRRGL